MELVPVVSHETDPGNLQLVLRTKNDAVLYDPVMRQVILCSGSAHEWRDAALPQSPERMRQLPWKETHTCPTCKQPLQYDDSVHEDEEIGTPHTAPHYFRLLSETSVGRSSAPAHTNMTPLSIDATNQGYYARFFVELGRLGRGARGTVWLCQHVLNGHRLGTYAVKKIPVGDYSESLLRSLGEVHLMESLDHPNVIHYKHAWIETAQTSAFTPCVPTLHVLMMAANGGSLADWIAARSGAKSDADAPEDTVSSVSSARVARLKAEFRQQRDAAKRHENTSASQRSSIHFLREEDIVKLLRDIAQGLGFLHDRGILHLDIKPENVLLHWDDDALLPTAMLSDFGSSLPFHENYTRERTGYTGTLEYMAPEVVGPDVHTGQLQELNSKADVWSLGIIFFLLIFLDIPYSHVDDIARLRHEILAFRGLEQLLKRRGWVSRYAAIHPSLTHLLARMLDVDAHKRPSCSEVLHILDTYAAASTYANTTVPRRPSFRGVLENAQREVQHSPDTTHAWSRSIAVVLLVYTQFFMMEFAYVGTPIWRWIREPLLLLGLVQVLYTNYDKRIVAPLSVWALCLAAAIVRVV
ncbi:putative serine/threonine-protein kinase iks1 [Malassezia vespertilionis]|uniref:Iks1p n=1 Tax=Malassezia vespertilionis TaxID=2020962 RepID=A0A2N1JDZ1_9BASI|nr:putative serine/threonine-protein kinase iks1 [Malassezia vespertilionis]PKI84754.1 Iks1p [Malassezia vespertilionis]WFD05820.1 putative serine/threonine-protein kinase iks1 [Malassezia vespertilionis]